MANIRHFRDLDVYRMAMESAMRIFDLSKVFPAEERYSLTDQIRRSSRSVCANIAEAWRKRRYPNAFVSKLSDAEAEAAETEVWLEIAVLCGYLSKKELDTLAQEYEFILGKLVKMISHPDHWVVRQVKEGDVVYGDVENNPQAD